MGSRNRLKKSDVFWQWPKNVSKNANFMASQMGQEKFFQKSPILGAFSQLRGCLLRCLSFEIPPKIRREGLVWTFAENLQGSYFGGGEFLFGGGWDSSWNSGQRHKKTIFIQKHLTAKKHLRKHAAGWNISFTAFQLLCATPLRPECGPSLIMPFTMAAASCSIDFICNSLRYFWMAFPEGPVGHVKTGFCGLHWGEGFIFGGGG